MSPPESARARVFVVTGTDTDVGKTVFSAALTAALDGWYWKPVQAGLDGGGDRDRVLAMTGLAKERVLPNAYCLATPCSPHRAAAIDGVTIDPARLALPSVPGPLVVEGAGGALVPIVDGPGGMFSYADMFARWAMPVVVVARTGLGTINHSLLTIEALRARRVPILGIAFIGDAEPDAEDIIPRVGGVRRLGRLARVASLDPETLRAAFDAGFDREDFRADCIADPETAPSPPVTGPPVTGE